MAENITKPLTFDAANKWLASRVNLPTGKSSLEIALDIPEKVRAHAFFSATVAEADILDKIRKTVDAFSRGEMNLAQARTELKLMLATSGYGYVPSDVADPAAGPPPGVDEEDWKEAKSIRNLGSTRRLDLILRQNASMAQAVGERETFMDPDLMERWPYVRYCSLDDARPSHRALNGKVFRKDDPFLLTHWPPWDYNCRCWLEEVAEDEFDAKDLVSPIKIDEENYKMDLDGQLFTFGPNESGYKFDVSAPFESGDSNRFPDHCREAAVAIVRDYLDQNKITSFKINSRDGEA